jgi:hypothetical protein
MKYFISILSLLIFSCNAPEKKLQSKINSISCEHKLCVKPIKFCSFRELTNNDTLFNPFRKYIVEMVLSDVSNSLTKLNEKRDTAEMRQLEQIVNIVETIVLMDENTIDTVSTKINLSEHGIGLAFLSSLTTCRK